MTNKIFVTNFDDIEDSYIDTVICNFFNLKTITEDRLETCTDAIYEQLENTLEFLFNLETDWLLSIDKENTFKKRIKHRIKACVFDAHIAGEINEKK